jgi:hypothetical protein
MVIKTTRWSPDTCECIFEYSWDTEQPEDTRTHNLTTVIDSCDAHQSGTQATRWDTVNEENPRKNRALQIIIDNAPAAFVDTDLQGNKSLKPGLSLDFTVAGTAPNRVFTLIFKGQTLTQNQMDFVQGKLDTRFGVGKVIFVNQP